jgi:broad specificity phosphatase PhoE
VTTRLLLTRHGESTSNASRRFTGHSEAALTALGRRQARALGRRLRHTPIDAAYASDLQRALDTARLATTGRGLEVQIEPRLREMSFGEWEGLTYDEIREGWPDHHHMLRSFDDSFHAPGGEPYSQTRTRIVEAFGEIAGRHRDETVLIVAHGGTIQIILQHVLGLPQGGLWRLSTNNCGLSVVDFAGERAVVTRVNDTAHLEPRRPASTAT